MKLVIAGSRTIEVDPVMMLCFINHFLKAGTPLHIISGGAFGIDKSAERFCLSYNLPITIFKADWHNKGRAAGPIRNKQMADEGDALLLIWDGKSKGSTNMKKQMKDVKKPIYEVILSK